jgi:hypothetical protein
MRRSGRLINHRPPSRRLKESGQIPSGDSLPAPSGSFCDSMRNSRASTVPISALPIVKSGEGCPVFSSPDLYGNSWDSAFWISSDLDAYKEIAVSTPSVIGGGGFVTRKNARGSRPFSERSKNYRGKRDHQKNGKEFSNSAINSSEPRGPNMARIINRLSPGDVEADAVLSPRDVIRLKFYHHVKKIYHHVMLKTIFLRQGEWMKNIGPLTVSILWGENLATFGIRKKRNYRQIRRSPVPFLSPQIEPEKINSLKRNEI